jgi:hypothetical protein
MNGLMKYKQENDEVNEEDYSREILESPLLEVETCSFIDFTSEN